MNITNEDQLDTPRLTKIDLAIASYALAETFNSYLLAYEAEDYGEEGKERMEDSMNRIRTAFVKFDTLLGEINKQEDEHSEVTNASED